MTFPWERWKEWVKGGEKILPGEWVEERENGAKSCTKMLALLGYRIVGPFPSIRTSCTLSIPDAERCFSPSDAWRVGTCVQDPSHLCCPILHAPFRACSLCLLLSLFHLFSSPGGGGHGRPAWCARPPWSFGPQGNCWVQPVRLPARGR